ncbi:hypothetical protein [Rhodanobacter sp. MP7CTX1]|uniref:hypothetical protein n=1 Tax=Rhodanobacter sp. MP7CTX1 TaxID=2723084 RepID=UPI001613EABF|nr:hypothetical protein [Rhodanobacter sp. MP7CTX1]MBB6188215.1 hypothetical protein [Rhodanobacter sp. MP7CTX1]
MYKPRFDFGKEFDPSGEQTGTVKDLLEELNYEKFKTAAGTHAERGDSNGTSVTFDSLSGVFEFLNDVTGMSQPKLAQDIPLSTLKTVKLLYVTNDTNDTQLFRLLKSPLRGGKPSLEFYTTETPSRNQKGIAIVDHLLSTLSIEVDPAVLRRINISFLTYPKLLECIAQENLEILEPIYERHHGQSASIAKAIAHLAEAVKHYKPMPHRSDRPLPEALYTYLRILPFLNFVGEYQEVIELSRVGNQVDPILDKIDNFCSELSIAMQSEVHHNTPITSVEGFPAFVDSNSLALAKLVQHATGIASERRDILKIVNASSKVLCSYVHHEWGIISLDTKNITVVDCIATLCTIRHQQKVKTNYSAYWLGQEQSDKGTSVLRQMDDARSSEELFEHDYIPHGINQLLFSRFNQFHMAITGKTGRYSAWMELQLARLTKYAECYQSNDVSICDDAVQRFYEYCTREAIKAADIA